MEKKLLVIGGVAAGLKAEAKARRCDHEMEIIIYHEEERGLLRRLRASLLYRWNRKRKREIDLQDTWEVRFGWNTGSEKPSD